MNMRIEENHGICKISMIVNGKRVSTSFGFLDYMTDEDIAEFIVRIAHRKLNQLQKELKAD